MLINGLIPYYINDIMGVEWYVADLLILFMITPLLAHCIHNLRSSIIAMIVALLISVVFQTIYRKYYGPVEDYDISTFFGTFCFVIQFPGMLLGVVIYYLTVNTDINKKKILKIYSLFAVLTIALFLLVPYSRFLISHSFVNCIVWGFVMLSCVMYEQKKTDIIQIISNSKIGKSIIQLGTYSFGIYLIHMLVIRYFNICGFNKYCNDSYCWIISFVTIIVISFIIGFIMEKLTSKLQSVFSSGIMKKSSI